jgi:hypothetical protein
MFENESGILLTAFLRPVGTLGPVRAQSPSVHGSVADSRGKRMAW